MTLDLPVHADAAVRARRALHDVFVAWDIRDDDWMYDALLVVSELVADGSSVVPQMREDPDEDDEAGRGMSIIDALTDTWGVESLPAGGKRVWAEMHVPA